MKLPKRLIRAYVMDKAEWDYFTYTATPHFIIDEMMFFWHIQDMAAKADERIAKRKSSSN